MRYPISTFIRILILITCFESAAFAQTQNGCPEPKSTTILETEIERGRAYIACIKSQRSVGNDSTQVQARMADGGGENQRATPQDQNQGPDLNQLEVEQAKLERKKNFTDFDWGIGVGVAFGDSQRVESAVVENGVVRVTEDNTDEARILLEIHKFFTPFQNKDIGIGPFAMVTAGGTDGDVLSSFGLGVMLGFRRDSDDSIASKSTNARSWNLGIGMVLDNDVQVLGEGIIANEALPDGVSEIRFNKKSEDALAIIFSTTF